jgi:hypothetical protein
MFIAIGQQTLYVENQLSYNECYYYGNRFKQFIFYSHIQIFIESIGPNLIPFRMKKKIAKITE